MSKASLLIVDDDTALTTMLEEYLTGMGFDVVSEHNGEDGLIRATSGHHFDVILLDVMMPKKDGFDLLKTLRTTHYTPVIMLTARGDDYDRVLGLEFGADDYLPKPFNHRELIARINALIRRQTEYSEQKNGQTFTVGQLSIKPSAQAVLYCDKNVELTGTEFATLYLLMRRAGQLVSKEVISEEVLGKKLMAFDRSIDMHVSNIRKKLSAISPVPTIKTVRGSGYILLCD